MRELVDQHHLSLLVAEQSHQIVFLKQQLRTRGGGWAHSRDQGIGSIVQESGNPGSSAGTPISSLC